MKIRNYVIGYRNGKLGIFRINDCCGYTGFMEDVIVVEISKLGIKNNSTR